MVTLRDLVQLGLHVVAQIVETKLVVRRVCDVAGISLALFGLGLLRVDDTSGHAQGCEHLAHPRSVAAGQIIVDRHNVNTAPDQRVQIGREGRDKRLTFTRFHLCNVTLVQEHPAHQLHIMGPQTQSAARGLAAVGKCFG